MAAVAHAQQVPIDPASTHIFPAGGQRGTVVPVRVGSECLPPNTGFRLWGEGVQAPAQLGERARGHYEPSLRRDPRETPMAYPKEWQSTVTVAADAPLGTKLWRLSSARGGTAARPFVVGELPEIVESESNSAPEMAQVVTLPVTINGQIAGERDTDYFQFTAQQGQIITAEVVAARIGSPLETVIEIHDLAGHRMEAQPLRAGNDPVLVFQAPAGGAYRLFVANLSFRGGPAFVYRVTLSALPYVEMAFPPKIVAGRSQVVELLAAHGSRELVPRHESVLAPAEVGEVWLAPPATANRIALLVTDGPSGVEQEPNNSAQQAKDLSPHTLISGQLASADDEDWFRFAARQGQFISVDCRPFPRSSPALPVASIVNGSGATLVSVKSAECADRKCALDWRVPADGEYFIRVADVRQGAAGGKAFVYVLSFSEDRPGFSLAAKADFANVVQGGRTEWELAVTRRGGFEGPIDLSMEGLPDGVTFEPKLIPPNQNVAKIAFIAADGARPTAAILRVTGSAAIHDQTVSRIVQAAHVGHDADGVGLGAETIDNVQLTVAHKPVFKLLCSEAYQYAYRGTVYPYLMEVERLDGFAGPIHLEVADRQIKDLDGIEVREMTVEPGSSAFKLPLYLPETMHINIQAHSNVYAQGYVSFVDKWGQPQSHLVVSTMRCMVRTLPPVAKLQAIDRQVSAAPGATVDCRLELIRTSNFSGPMQIELVNSPAMSGLSAERVTLASKESTATIAVRVGPEIVPRAGATVTFRATGSMPGDVQVISEAEVALKFE